jgi:Uma2 family endonuclease
MTTAIDTLKMYFAGQRVYVSGNLLLFYKPGNRRRHVSPDVLVTKGLEQRDRDNYLLWEEGLAPQFVIEVTSTSTRDEDLEDKFEIYRDQIKVAEYFLFDPRGEYLAPTLQGYRLRGGVYEPIRLLDGRLPSLELGLHLEKHDADLRFFDPQRGGWLPTPQEDRQQQAEARRRAEEDRQREAESRRRAEEELERLRQELAAVRRSRDT